MNVVDAFSSPELFRPLFEPLETWASWLTLAKASYGLELDARELETFQRHTGREKPREGGYPEVVAIVGRQSGKTRFSSTIASFEALKAKKKLGQPAPYALIVAQDLRGALRASFSYCAEAFDAVPTLRQSVLNKTAQTLELENGCVLAAYPCRPSATRGLRAVVVIADELAFFRSSEGYPTDVEMLRAVRPTLATTGGKLFVLSSPYGQMGALWNLHRQHYGKDSETLVWQATALQMNPTLPADYLERMRRDDPEAAKAELDGEFRAGLALLFAPEAIDACVVSGRLELARANGIRYRGFVDVSGGRADAFVTGVGHKENETAVIDAMRVWKPPFNPEEVVEEAAEFFRGFGVRTILSDKYAGEWPVTAFWKHGISCRQAAAPKSELYLRLLPKVNSGAVELLDEPELLRELRGLERRRGSAKDRVDHGPGAHDDRANVAAGLVWDMDTRYQRDFAVDIGIS